MTEKNKFNPWPIGIALFCVTAFAGAILVAMVMIKQSVDIVRPDYYAQDRRHETRMGQERNALALKNPIVIEYDESTRAVHVDFPATNVIGSITLYRPSDLSLDQEFPVFVDENSRQMIDASGLASGLWRVRVEWFQDDQGYYQEKAMMLP